MKPTTVGFVVAGLYILFKMALYLSGQQYEIMFGKAAMVLMALVMVGIFYSINFYVRSSDTYDWMAAFKKGITVSLIASVVVGVFLIIYYKAIDANYLYELKIAELNKMSPVIKQSDLPKYNDSLQKRYTAMNLGTMTTALVNIVGLLCSLIVAVLGRMTVRRKA